MEGKVIISLRDYEELKKDAEKNERINNHYFNLASKQVDLLERVEEFLKGEKIASGLADGINVALSQWYG